MSLAYPDTSFLFSLYVLDAHTSVAASFLKRWRGTLSWTSLQQYELRNAIRLSVFRKDITIENRQAALQEMESDFEAGILAHTTLSWSVALREAERLSAVHTEALGNRGIDILHVAAALAIKAKYFLTFDKRQFELAKASGLKVLPQYSPLSQ